MIATKYEDISFKKKVVLSDFKRLINQIWKLIPMRENAEDWKKQINQVLIEIIGLQELFKNRIDLLLIITKLEGLREQENLEFMDYRSTIFSVISLLGEANERFV